MSATATVILRANAMERSASNEYVHLSGSDRVRRSDCLAPFAAIEMHYRANIGAAAPWTADCSLKPPWLLMGEATAKACGQAGNTSSTEAEHETSMAAVTPAFGNASPGRASGPHWPSTGGSCA